MSFAALYFRVTKEVDEVIGMKQDISYDDLGHLTYLSQVPQPVFEQTALIYYCFNVTFCFGWMLSTNPPRRYSRRP